MKTITPEKSIAYWQHVERNEPHIANAAKRHLDILYREAKRAERERQLREIIWYIGATFSAVAFTGLTVAFIVLIWAAMQ